MNDPIPILTVGDLRSELSRWHDDTPVTFRSPLKEREYSFYRFQSGDHLLVVELNDYPEAPTVLRPGA